MLHFLLRFATHVRGLACYLWRQLLFQIERGWTRMRRILTDLILV